MSAQKKRKVTRLAKCCSFVGSSRELPLADLPTYSDIVAYGNFLKEQSDVTLNLNDICKQITSKTILMYQKVGTDIPLIKEDSVLKNVKRYLHI